MSRLSTALHAAGSAVSPRPGSVGVGDREPSPRLVMLVLFFVSIPVAIAFFSILRISSWLTTPLMFTVLALFFLFTAVSSIFWVPYAGSLFITTRRLLYP